MKVVKTDNAPAAIGPYSQGIVVNGMLFASGQIPLDPKTGEIVGQTIAQQATQALTNVKNLLEAAGTDLNHVVKTTCFLADINDFAAFNEVYAQFFTENLPARSAVGVAGLPKGALCEVEVVAVVE
jgi:2-iminobutanoate/2-iminopropanoate deaminase